MSAPRCRFSPSSVSSGVVAVGRRIAGLALLLMMAIATDQRGAASSSFASADPIRAPSPALAAADDPWPVAPSEAVKAAWSARDDVIGKPHADWSDGSVLQQLADAAIAEIDLAANAFFQETKAELEDPEGRGDAAAADGADQPPDENDSDEGGLPSGADDSAPSDREARSSEIPGEKRHAANNLVKAPQYLFARLGRFLADAEQAVLNRIFINPVDYYTFRAIEVVRHLKTNSLGVLLATLLGAFVILPVFVALSPILECGILLTYGIELAFFGLITAFGLIESIF